MNRITYQHCPLCQSNEIELVFEVKDHKISQETFSLSDCKSCGFRFTADPPNENEIGKYYDSPRYISHSNNNQGPINRVYHYIRSLMLRCKLNLIRKISTQRNVLDIGCGIGFFLNTMKENGFKTLGIEINENARNFAKSNFQLDVIPPSFLTENKIADKFDVATMWHVLEHIYEPKAYLNAVSNVLNDNAHLIIAVPNYRSMDAQKYLSFWAGYDVPRHLWHFDPKSINTLLSACGFELKSIKRLPFDSFYVSMLSETYLQHRFSFIRGMFYGGLSWIKSLINKNKTSSLIYIFQKKSS
ncbi:MAG: class I SAM-dependent methyltransferase [Saprospiraceae bacterium]